MSKIINVKSSSYLLKSGKFISRKGYRRILGSKISLTQAKKRVRALRSALDRLKLLTEVDKEKLEYGLLLSKTRKSGNLNVIKGYKLGDKKAINLPTEGKRSWVLHSHPTTRPLSLGDITSAKNNIFAISTDGSIYRANNISKNKDEIRSLYDKAKSKLLVSYPNATEETQSVMQHRLLQHLDSKGLLRYKFKLSDEAKKRIDKFKEIMSIELKRSQQLANFKRYYKNWVV